MPVSVCLNIAIMSELILVFLSIANERIYRTYISTVENIKIIIS